MRGTSGFILDLPSRRVKVAIGSIVELSKEESDCEIVQGLIQQGVFIEIPDATEQSDNSIRAKR